MAEKELNRRSLIMLRVLYFLLGFASGITFILLILVAAGIWLGW